jgi:hypothetical protein
MACTTPVVGEESRIPTCSSEGSEPGTSIVAEHGRGTITSHASTTDDGVLSPVAEHSIRTCRRNVKSRVEENPAGAREMFAKQGEQRSIGRKEGKLRTRATEMSGWSADTFTSLIKKKCHLFLRDGIVRSMCLF